jgi:antitoxin (DNA-binding transcriptional repressor) of toxin-antitoxin stability system
VSIIVNIGAAKTRLSELIVKVEAGEDVVIARDGNPVARLSRVRRDTDVATLIAEIRAARAGLEPTTAEELLAWRDEDRRFQ